MRPRILRQAWFIQNFKKNIGEIANFLLQNEFTPETVQRSLQPAWEAIKAYEGKGDIINEPDVMKKITQGIVQFGREQGINFNRIKHIPHIDSKYLGILLAGFEKPTDLPADASKVKLPRPRRQTIKNIQQEIIDRKKLEEEAAKDAPISERAKAIKEVKEQLFREQALHLNDSIMKYIQRKGK